MNRKIVSNKMIPNPMTYNPRPNYIRQLIKDAGFTQSAAASTIGVSLRAMQDYLNPNHSSQIPYVAQFCLEVLVECKGE